MRIFNEIIVGNFLLASSQFFTKFNLGGPDGLNNNNKIQDQTLSANMTIFQSPNFEWRTGSQIKQLDIQYLSTFLEDTSFYHKGNFPKKERGLLAIIYNLSNW